MSETSEKFSQFSVMIVDDNRHMRALLCSIVKALGVKRIKEIGDGETVMNEIEAFEPDLVITDWNMEPMDGISLVRNIRHSSSDVVRHVSIIMLTGHAEMDRVREARDSGVHEFLAKPVSAKALHQRMTMIAENPRPFITTDEYFGPDRRRRDLGPPDGEPERRGDAAGTGAKDAELSPEEALSN